jgi:hypothetical protein
LNFKADRFGSQQPAADFQPLRRAGRGVRP